jgi:uncharacterized protein YgbK (DUF1537 family)
MCPNDAYHAVYKAIKAFDTVKKGFFVYKKVDSMLRGNPGQELAAVMDALDIPLAIVAPAFPANRSILENGHLASGIDAVQIIANRSKRKTANIPLKTIRQSTQSIVTFIHNQNDEGTQIFVADAVNDTDLAAIYAASLCLGKPHLLAGSAGLANQLACNQDNVNDEEKNPAILTPALVIAGSRQTETAAQILSLSQSLSIPIIRFKVSLVMEGKSDKAIKEAQTEAAELMQHNTPICIIAVESLFHTNTVNQHYTEGDETSDAIADALGKLTKSLYDAFHFPLLISTGGDTSTYICRHTGITKIEPLREIYPGIPLARIVGSDYDGRFIITKSGRFGEPDTLLKILHKPQNTPY